MSDQRSPEAGGGQGKGKQRVAWNLLFIPESRVTVVTLDKNRRGEEGGFLPFRKDNIQTQGGKAQTKSWLKYQENAGWLNPSLFLSVCYQFQVGVFAGRDILDPEQNFWREQNGQTNLGRLGKWL